MRKATTVRSGGLAALVSLLFAETILAAPGPFTMTGAVPDDMNCFFETAIKITWQESADAFIYRLYRNDVERTRTFSTDYTDTSVESGVRYVYYVIAEGSGFSETRSQNTVEATRNCPPGPFAINPPSTACVENRPQVSLRWTPADDVVSYQVLRQGNVIAGGIAATFYTDSTTVSGATYTYNVRAVNRVNSRLAQAAVSVTAPSCAPGPFTLTVTSECLANIPIPQNRLNWTAADGAITYDVNRTDRGVIATALLRKPASTRKPRRRRRKRKSRWRARGSRIC